MAENQGQKSDDADKEQLKLAAQQGQAFMAAADHMMNEEADDGQKQTAGDYVVGYAIEEAEGMYQWEGGELVWRNPTNENAHIEIVVADARDGRFVPGLVITLTLMDEEGTVIGSHPQPFLWHSWLYHYGRNWVVPGNGTYRMKISIRPPSFMRHDKANGSRYAKPIVVEFDNVHIKTGQKLS